MAQNFSTMDPDRLFHVPREMSQETFGRFRDFISARLGIKMPDVKITMLQSRLQKRLRILRISSYETYYDYVFSPKGRESELPHMVDAVTTNKTDFFREPKHFDCLTDSLLPDLLKRKSVPGSSVFWFWSAGCSTGAEPYTLAMVLSEFSGRNPGFPFKILATDISNRVLAEAKSGIYTEDMIAPVPHALRKRYLLRSKNPEEGMVRIVPELRSKIEFGQLNFMDNNFGLDHVMDVIFCRNVMIYFDRPTQEGVVNRLCRYLRPGGHLFIGHSETLNGLAVPLVQVSPTIYRRLETT